MSDDQTPLLVQAVSKLTVAVEKLDNLLRDEYPKRTEVERNFVTKLENQKVVAKFLVVALITVLGCYVFTVGAYSQCFVGDESPGVCKYVPGYDERVERRDQINEKFDDLEDKIKRLEQKKAGRR